MAEIIDLSTRRPPESSNEVRALAAVPARDLGELRQKAHLLPLCRDRADALFLYAQILADIEALAEETARP
jgi:hypothetical protein